MAVEVHVFRGYSAAKNWADKKNAKARKYWWVVRSRSTGGYGVYKMKKK